MRFIHLCSAVSIAVVSSLASTAWAEAQPSNPLLALLNSGCSAAELGKVTRVAVLDAKQTNAIFKKGNAPQDAKPGNVYTQIFASSKAEPKDFFVSKLKRTPTSSETMELVGKPQCTTSDG